MAEVDQSEARLAAAGANANQAEQGFRATVEHADARISAIDANLKQLDELVRTATASVLERTSTLDVAVKTAQTLLAQIEEANRKANSESGYAYNAKVHAEEHAKAIAQTRGAAEVDAAAVSASKASAEAQGQALAQARTTADEHLQFLTTTRDAVARHAEGVTAASQRVAAAMPAIEKGIGDANAISATKANADAGLAAIQSAQTQLGEIAGKAASDAAGVAKSNDECMRITTAMNDAQKRVDAMNINLAQYEQGIEKARGDFDGLRDKIEALLPGATSAGLASAFHSQKDRFKRPQWLWLALFVAAIVALISAALVGLPPSSDTWDAITRHLVNRLPLVAPLVWLAIYAGHHYNMALRMQEEYAFKEAVSRAFEGYKREMEQIDGASSGGEKPLVTLCENVLRALAERPGRIYEGRADVATPLSPIANTLKDIAANLAKRDSQS